MAKFLVRKTIGNVVTLKVEADNEEEAAQRARAGDGEIVKEKEITCEVIGRAAEGHDERSGKTIPNPPGVH